jgi:DNA-binding transcriptional regulator YhcF (GntR family)
MKSSIKININSQIPVYKQLINSIEDLINSGVYSNGYFLPSMNDLSNELEISKETVKKAYSILRENGIIDSAHGKGFYVSNSTNKKSKILLIFDKISAYKLVSYNSFANTIGDFADINIRLHNQDIDAFEKFIDESIDKYDYYVVTSHFPFTIDIQKRALKALNRIPNRKLILMDHNIKGLSGKFGAIFQDYEQDIQDGLFQGIEDIKKFKKLNVISMKGSLYAPFIQKGIDKFCTENNINYQIYSGILPKKIEKNEVYLILNGQLDIELIEIVRTAKLNGFEIGKDIGLISYNESPINEIILSGLTVLSTDFKQMGEIAAKMILQKEFSKQKCDFKLIRRGTF